MGSREPGAIFWTYVASLLMEIAARHQVRDLRINFITAVHRKPVGASDRTSDTNLSFGLRWGLNKIVELHKSPKAEMSPWARPHPTEKFTGWRRSKCLAFRAEPAPMLH